MARTINLRKAVNIIFIFQELCIHMYNREMINNLYSQVQVSY